jgi:hypothetical protein
MPCPGLTPILARSRRHLCQTFEPLGNDTFSFSRKICVSCLVCVMARVLALFLAQNPGSSPWYRPFWKCILREMCPAARIRSSIIKLYVRRSLKSIPPGTHGGKDKVTHGRENVSQHLTPPPLPSVRTFSDILISRGFDFASVVLISISRVVALQGGNFGILKSLPWFLHSQGRLCGQKPSSWFPPGENIRIRFGRALRSRFHELPELPRRERRWEFRR